MAPFFTELSKVDNIKFFAMIQNTNKIINQKIFCIKEIIWICSSAKHQIVDKYITSSISQQ